MTLGRPPPLLPPSIVLRFGSVERTLGPQYGTRLERRRGRRRRKQSGRGGRRWWKEGVGRRGDEDGAKKESRHELRRNLIPSTKASTAESVVLASCSLDVNEMTGIVRHVPANSRSSSPFDRAYNALPPAHAAPFYSPPSLLWRPSPPPLIF